jgi:hypothetical protein
VWFGQGIEEVIDTAEQLCHQAVQLDASASEALIPLHASLDVGPLRSTNVVAAALALLRNHEDGRGVQVAFHALAVVFPTSRSAKLEGCLEKRATLGDEPLATVENRTCRFEYLTSCLRCFLAVDHLIAYISITEIRLKGVQTAENLGP